MTMRKNPFSRIKLVYRRSSTLTKCVVLAAIVLCTAALLTLRGAILSEQAKEEAYRKEAAALEQQNSDLSEDIEKVDSVEGMKDIAEDKLGLVDPDTVIFIPEQ